MHKGELVQGDRLLVDTCAWRVECRRVYPGSSGVVILTVVAAVTRMVCSWFGADQLGT